MKLKTKIHEWAADNFKSVQYPNVTVENGYQHQEPKLTKFEDKVLMFCYLMVVIPIGLICIVAGCFVLWAIIASL